MTNESVKQMVTKNPLQTIQLSITLIGLIATILAVYITYKLAPLSENIAIVASAQKANDDRDTREHAQMIRRDELNLIKERVERIDQNTQQLYNHFLK